MSTALGRPSGPASSTVAPDVPVFILTPLSSLLGWLGIPRFGYLVVRPRSIAIVTGAARGIGAAVAARLARGGMRVLRSDIVLDGGILAGAAPIPQR